MSIMRVLCFVLGFACSAAAFAQAWSPQKNVEIVVGSAPGGSNDKTARTVEQILTHERLLPVTLTVVNKPGGTAFRYRVEGVDACGKTGTVQVVAQKEAKKTMLLPEKLRDHAWFAAFAPREDAKIVVVVFAAQDNAA